MFRITNPLLCRLDRRLTDLIYSRFLKSRNLVNGALKTLGKLFYIYLITVLTQNIDHIHRNHHRDSKLHKLRGKIEISLDISAVNYIKYCIGSFKSQIISCNNLF